MDKPLAQLKSLSDANRLKMVLALFHHSNLCACQIVEWLGVTGATVSRHLQILQMAGLVVAEKDGRWVHFRLSSGFPRKLRAWLEEEGNGLSAKEKAKLAAVLRENPSELCRRQRSSNP